MGGMSARKALKMVENVEYIIGVEMLAALTSLGEGRPGSILNLLVSSRFVPPPKPLSPETSTA